MFDRIKLLVLLQLSDKFKFKKIDDIKKFVAKIGLIILRHGLKKKKMVEVEYLNPINISIYKVIK